MIYTCNVLCYAEDQELLEMLNKEDEGKWLPFAFNMSIVESIKMTTDDIDSISFNKTSINTTQDNTYVIDVNYQLFLEEWKNYHNKL